MALVINDTVKMEWQENRWLQTVGRGKKPPVFILACKDYSVDGKIVPVFFNPFSAWVHADADGTFSFAEIKDFLASEADSTFPENYSEYKCIVKAGSDEVDMSVVEEFGLGEYVDDIVARLRDIEPYGEEKEVAAQG